MQIHWNKALPGVVLAAAVLALPGCNREAPSGRRAAPVVTIQAAVSNVAESNVPEYASVPGTVVAAQQVQVASRLMGFVQDMPVHEGQKVQAGQLLFRVDPSNVEGRVRQAQSALLQARSAWNDAQSDFTRFQNLYKQGAVSLQRFQKIRTRYEVARSQVSAAQAALETAKAQLDYAVVRAPISGIIVQKLAEQGDTATPGRPLLVLENPAALQVSLTVAEEVFQHLSIGGVVWVDGTGKPVKGTVQRLVPAADPVTHTHLVKIALPDDSGLRSGAFVTVRIPVGNRRTVVVPTTALQNRAGIPGVFIVDAKGFAHYRMVRPGGVVNGGTEILAGVEAGDRLVTAPTAAVNNGVRIAERGASADE